MTLKLRIKEDICITHTLYGTPPQHIHQNRHANSTFGCQIINMVITARTGNTMAIENPINLTLAINFAIQRVNAHTNTLYLKAEAAMAISICALGLLTDHPSICTLSSKNLNTLTTHFLCNSFMEFFQILLAMASSIC